MHDIQQMHGKYKLNEWLNKQSKLYIILCVYETKINILK